MSPVTGIPSYVLDNKGDQIYSEIQTSSIQFDLDQHDSYPDDQLRSWTGLEGPPIALYEFCDRLMCQESKK